MKTIHQTLSNAPGQAVNTLVISNRAMNVFLADKTGYLAEHGDLSFYTNFITLNSAEGKVAVYHNLQQPAGKDDPIRKLPGIGIWGNLGGSYAATFSDKSSESGLGITLGYKWLEKVKTSLGPAVQKTFRKNAMDALRSAIVYSLINDVQKRSADFERALNSIQATDVPGQDIDSAKALMRKTFYQNLPQEYAEKFARQQAATLSATKNFNCIRTGWTSLEATLPLLLSAYTVAPSLTGSFRKKKTYGLGLLLSHTRLWESSQAGRFFITLSGAVYLNNTRWSYGLRTMDRNEYKTMGGVDTTGLALMRNDRLYIGDYHSFLTPAIKARLVYFPPASHIGICAMTEQNIGSFHTLNSRISIPIVLINAHKTPAVNMEFAVLLTDLTHTLAPSRKVNRSLFALNIGIPLSRLMY